MGNALVKFTAPSLVEPKGQEINDKGIKACVLANWLTSFSSLTFLEMKEAINLASQQAGGARFFFDDDVKGKPDVTLLVDNTSRVSAIITILRFQKDAFVYWDFFSNSVTSRPPSFLRFPTMQRKSALAMAGTS